MNFTEFLQEARQDKNLHLEHLEDNILNRGVTGARESINFLQSLRDMLAGKSSSKINVTTNGMVPQLFLQVSIQRMVSFLLALNQYSI